MPPLGVFCCSVFREIFSAKIMNLIALGNFNILKAYVELNTLDVCVA